MAVQTPNNVDVQAGRYAERRAPQFIGGEVEQATGNIIPQTRESVSVASRPTTRLQDIEADEKPATTGTSSTEPLSSANYALGSGQASATRLGRAGDEAGGPSMAGMLPALGRAAAGTVAPVAGSTFGASIGSSLGSGAGVGEAVGNAVSNLGSNLWSTATGGGPAASVTSSAAESALGATLGGGVGAGLGSFATDLLMGGDIRTATESGVGAGIGFAVGNALLPGIGGVVGSFVGDWLFSPGGITENGVLDDWFGWD